MTAGQKPPGSRKTRRLAPDELARELANRLKSARGADRGHRRFLPRFDLLNAGRLIMGLAAVLVGVGLVAGFTWLSGLAGYETAGTVSETTPAFACPGEPELGKVFEGERITLIGLSPDQTWLAVRDNRGPGDAVYVARSLVAVEGDVGLLSTRECQPSQQIAAGQTSAAPVEDPSTSLGVVTTTDSTLNGATGSTEGSGLPGASGTIPRALTTTTTQPDSVTTTTRPNSVTTQPATTTSPTSSTTSTTSSTTSSTTTSSTTSSTTPSTTTSTTVDTTTTTEVTTTSTTEPSTTTTTMP